MILATLHDAAHEIGMRFPLTLGARGSCTIGGLTSTNAGGTQVLKFGTMRSLVAGVEAVLPDGSVHSGLSGLKKDNRGYSLDQLLIGAEGTLGVITAVALRLVPAIAARAVAWAGVDSAAARARTAALPRSAHQQRRRVRAGAREFARARAQAYPRHPRAADRRASAGTCWSKRRRPIRRTTSTAELEQLLGAALQQGIIARCRASASSEAQAEAFWKIREAISEAERAEGPDAGPRHLRPGRRHAALHRRGRGRGRARLPGVIASGFGHLGDGNIHFHVRAGSHAAPDWYEREGAAITRLVDDLVTAAGGSISAEHGIGQLKLAEFARLAPPGRIHALRAIKQALDPLGIMNPGKLVP